MGFFNDIFLSKDDKAVIDIYNELNRYWNNTNDFIVAHQRYFENLNYKFKLGFDEDLLFSIPNILVSGSIMNDLSQKNTMFIFAQFIYYFIFGWQIPNRNRNNDEYIISVLDNLDDYFVKNQSNIDKDIPIILNKNSAKKLN